MKINISGKGIDLTDSLKDQVNDKMKKLDRYFTDNTTANVALKTEKLSHIVEITIPVKGNVLRVQCDTEDMYKSIDQAVDVLERQIRKYRTKIKDRKIHNLMRNEVEGGFSEESVDELKDENEITIVKKKHFILKPMDPIEACMQADLIGHEFFLFRNSDTDTTCLVYKRKDGSFGLIEPEFD